MVRGRGRKIHRKMKASQTWRQWRCEGNYSVRGEDAIDEESDGRDNGMTEPAVADSWQRRRKKAAVKGMRRWRRM